jgi:hypothetical protein
LGVGRGANNPTQEKQIVTRSEKVAAERTYLRRKLGERNWKNLALNREEWRKLFKKVRAHTGLSSQ